MKFAHTYAVALATADFPAHWTSSAISYKRLKKCIKQVQQELVSLGLNAATLAQLLQTIEEEERQRSLEFQLQYVSVGEATHGRHLNSTGEVAPFRPILLVAVDAETGDPLSAKLSEETREYIRRLAAAKNLGASAQITELDGTEEESTSTLQRNTTDQDSQTTAPPTAEDDKPSARPHKLIAIPLSTDSAFFTTLETELSGLARLRSTERFRLSNQVATLGVAVAKLTAPTSSAAKHDLEVWRKVFDAYLQAHIFFGTSEREGHGARDTATAARHMQEFVKKVESMGVCAQGGKAAAVGRFKRQESVAALRMFVDLNAELLMGVRFWEIQRLALGKILKKFDKRTALPIRAVFPRAVPTASTLLDPSADLAKAICAEVSSSLLPLVPQLDDYLCPVCAGLCYRPVRLRCRHVFCIRCLVVLQRARRRGCPLCRAAVVCEADSDNIDLALAKFLKRYFPAEVKAKQRENERAAAVDQFGEGYENAKPCVVM